MLAHAQRHAQHHAARRQRVVGNPVHEATQLGRKRRLVKLFLDVADPVVQARPDLDPVGPHDAGCRARAERHSDEIARRKRKIARHAIGIGVVERDRHEHIHKARCGKRRGRRRAPRVPLMMPVVVPHVLMERGARPRQSSRTAGRVNFDPYRRASATAAGFIGTVREPDNAVHFRSELDIIAGL